MPITVSAREQIAQTRWSGNPSANGYWVRRLTALWDEWEPDRLVLGGDGRRVGPREVVYRPATSGRWGRSSRVYIGRELVTARQAREAQAAAARREQTLAPYRALLAELGVADCYAVGLGPAWLATPERGPSVYVYEVLHDCGGTFGDPVDSPEALRQYVQRRLADHRAVYHAQEA